MQEVIIGCDVGLKRIGIAQSINGIILPLTPILRQNRNQAANDLSILLSQKEANILVVGIPYSKNTQDMQNRIKYFISLITFSGEIVYIDENLTSYEAVQNLYHMPKKSRKNAHKNGIIDSFAACKILERYTAKNT